MDARGCGHDPDAGGVLSMKVESVSVDEISPDPANARMHDRRNLDAIAGSLRKWGQQKPIVISEAGVIVAGNGTWEAAKQIGWKRINAVKTKLEGSEAVAYGIADNRTAELAGWDDAVLGKHLEALQADESIDHLAAGFSDEEIKGLLAGLNGQDEVVEDEIPEPPAEPVTKAGELITLGDHRLLCGDSTNADNVARLMDGERADVVLTDPPYGLGDSVTSKNDYDMVDDRPENLVLLIDSVVGWCLKNVNRVVLTPGNKNQILYPRPTWTMAWFCPAGVGRGPWGFCCWQPILCYGKDPRLAAGEGAYPDALVHQEGPSCKEHPCAKPMEFWRWLLKRTTNAADLVFDPFMGSGTTMIACESDGRRCFGVEISPAYCDVIVQRWENLTGQKVQREMAMEAVV